MRLVEIRASQINGCANCINMHTAEARELSPRREAYVHRARTRGAWLRTEALTRLAKDTSWTMPVKP